MRKIIHKVEQVTLRCFASAPQNVGLPTNQTIIKWKRADVLFCRVCVFLYVKTATSETQRVDQNHIPKNA